MDDLGEALLVVDNGDGVDGVSLFHCPPAHLVNILFLYKVKAGGDVHALVHCAYLGNEGLGLFLVAAGGFNAGQFGKMRKLCVNRLAVVLKDDGKNDGVCKAVRRIVQAAERVRNCVDVADAGTGEGKARP